jgi:hypothetical protein
MEETIHSVMLVTTFYRTLVLEAFKKAFLKKSFTAIFYELCVSVQYTYRTADILMTFFPTRTCYIYASIALSPGSPFPLRKTTARLLC